MRGRDRSVRHRTSTHWIAALLLMLACSLLALPALAGVDSKYPQVRQSFPTASRFGDVTGDPPAAPVYRDDKVIGYVFESVMVAPVPAYSGLPINILVAIDTDGRIIQAEVLEQHEPILLVGIPVQKLYDFVSGYVGRRVTDQIVVGGGAGSVRIDAISSATVTSMVVNETVMNAALKVAVSRKLVAGAVDAGNTPASVRKELFAPADWQQLTANGAFGHLHLTRGMVTAAFKGQPESGLTDDPTATMEGEADATFIDLYYADIMPPSVGRNLLGETAYAQLLKKLQPGDEAIAVLANGLYSFKGVGYVRGGIFDRLHVTQDNKLFLFKDTNLAPLNDVVLKGMPTFDETAIFVLRHGGGFDPGRPWTLQLLVNRQVGPLKSIYNTFTSDYTIPAAYLSGGAAPAIATALGSAPPASAPLWQKVWHARRFDIAGLALGLIALSLILALQDLIVQRPTLLERLRVGFLIYTVVFIGWYELAQLSIVNILTFVHAVMNGFHWDMFLMDPLIFILWVFVAATLLLLGRGIYCGWLCPFGAIQVLVNKAARRLRVPQFEFPAAVHERLWAIKYLILLGLFGLSLQSVNLAERYAEIEPFKTAINLHFMRSWSYVLYAVLLIGVSAFNNKFYCRYVCPLGAGLAVSGRFHLFEWLRRRRECGRPCQICANECEVRAINSIGQINFNECHYCLDCQVTYANDRKCPPLVERRKKRERASRPLPTPIVTISVEPAPATEPAH